MRGSLLRFWNMYEPEGERLKLCVKVGTNVTRVPSSSTVACVGSLLGCWPADGLCPSELSPLCWRSCCVRISRDYKSVLKIQWHRKWALCLTQTHITTLCYNKSFFVLRYFEHCFYLWCEELVLIHKSKTKVTVKMTTSFIPSLRPLCRVVMSLVLVT